MANIQQIWDIQSYLAKFHLFTMAANSMITFFYIIRYQKLYLNNYCPSNPSSFLLNIGYFVLPLYYFFESYTTLSFCQAYLLYTCKYILHHLLTISLWLTIYQYSYYNSASLTSASIHGFMNIGYYYNKTAQFILCRWYGATMVYSLFYSVWVIWKLPNHRQGVFQVTLIALFLTINNYYTPELLAMCKITEEVYLIIPEYFIHFAGATGFGWMIWRNSKLEIEKIS